MLLASSPLARRRTVVLLVCSVTMALQWGCYSYQPVQSAPPPVQERLAVTLNDRGRFVLAERMGSSIEYVEGTLLSHNDSSVVLSVNGTKDLRGGTSTWSGEEVAIPVDAILGYRPRKLSKLRSFLLAGTIAGALAVLTFGTSLDVFGADGPDGGPVKPPDGGTTSSKAPVVGGIVPLPRF